MTLSWTTGSASLGCSASSWVGTRSILRRIHSNAQGYVVKRAAIGSYDWLYVLKADGKEYLLKECLADRRSVSPQLIHQLGAVAESGRMQLP